MADITSKKTVLITGCSSGIGHALAREFHAKGLHVFATARSKDAIADLEALGISTLSLEVTNSNSIAEAKSSVEKITGGRLDILVNNAGRNCTIPALDADLDDARACFETNFFSVMAITKAFAPLLIDAKGLILNIGSVAAVVPYVFGSVYNASKAALHAYSSTLRLELEPYDVRVLVVITGGVQSNIARQGGHCQKGAYGAMANEAYAKGVVGEALKPAWIQRKWMWRGNKSTQIWLVQEWIGKWLFDWVLPRMFGLARLRQLLRSRKANKKP